MTYRTDLKYNNGKIQVNTGGADARIPIPEAQLTDNLQLGYKAAVLNDLHKAGIGNDNLIEDALNHHENAVGFIKRFVDARENPHPSQTQFTHLTQLKQEHDRFTQNQAHMIQSKREKLQLKVAEIDKQFEQEIGFNTADAQEIRGNLRYMTDQDRNEVINSAIENKDGNILSSVLSAHPLNSGITAERQAGIRELAMHKHTPKLLAIQKASKRVDKLLFNTINDILTTTDNLTSKSVLAQYAEQAKKADALKF
jgi:hypothetical protein